MVQKIYPVDNLVTIVRAFAHQISHVVDSHSGYVLKYVVLSAVMLPPVIFCANAGAAIVTEPTTAAAMPKAAMTANAIRTVLSSSA